jgi:hypothetical protein
MTILVCLGETPDTWWQAKNSIGDRVLSRAEALAADDDVRKVVFEGKIVQTLTLYDLEPGLRERVWRVVERAARAVAEDESADWPPATISHVADLAREMEARWLDPDRPGVWP